MATDKFCINFITVTRVIYKLVHDSFAARQKNGPSLNKMPLGHITHVRNIDHNYNHSNFIKSNTNISTI